MNVFTVDLPNGRGTISAKTLENLKAILRPLGLVALADEEYGREYVSSKQGSLNIEEMSVRHLKNAVLKHLDHVDRRQEVLWMIDELASRAE